MKCIYTKNAERCEAECGKGFLCDFHRRTSTGPALTRLWGHVRGIVLSIAQTPSHEFVCYHCGDSFPREEICVDHFPRGRRSQHAVEMWDFENLVPSCQACNTSGNANRARSMRRKTLRPLQDHYVDSRRRLIDAIDELHATRVRLAEKGNKMPPIHEHVLLIAESLSSEGPPAELVRPGKQFR